MQNNLSICSLFEGDYHLGAAALVNSLAVHGYSGKAWFGIRGALPPWTKSLKRCGENSFAAGPVDLHFVTLETDHFLASDKAAFMLSILDQLDPTSEGTAYFDPDIVVTSPWEFFARWMQRGIALCEDSCFGSMSRNHLLRMQWEEFASKNLGRKVVTHLDRSYNSGFVGVTRKHLSFLEDWKSATLCLPDIGIDLDQFKPGDRRDPFFGTDQDTMNVACMITSLPLVTLGQEGMGFAPGLNVMSHAAENPKPWRRKYLSHLLRQGLGVSQAHREYWHYADGVVSPWAKHRLFWRRLDAKLAIILSRFYHSA